MPWELSRISRGRRELVVIVAVGLAMIAVVWLLTLERASYERREAVDAVQRANSNLALALEEQTVRALKQAEQALLFLKFEHEHDGKVVSIPTLVKEGMLDESTFTAPIIVDARGYVLLPDGKPGLTSLADREFFISHRDHADTRTLISKPVLGRITGRPVITLSRRVSGPDGVFNGVYSIGIDPHQFLRAYERFDLGRHGLIQLIGLDGVTRARLASGRATFGDDMNTSSILRHARRAPSGNFVSAGKLDGTQRFSSFRRLDDYSLVVGVGTAVDETLVAFRVREREYYLAAIVATLLLLALGAALLVAARHRGQAIAKLAASEELYRATFEQAGVGVVHVGLDGTFLKVNRKWCEMLGYPEEDLVSRKFADVTHPEDVARSKAMVGGVIDGGVPAEFEKRYLRKDGSVLSAAVSAVAVRSADGMPEYFVTVIQDITDKRRAELALRESERRFNDMLGRVELVSLMLDREARVTYCNDYLLRLTGWRREEVLGRNWFDLFIPAENAGLKEVFAGLLHDRPDLMHYENEILTRDGKRRMIRWNNTVLRSTAGEVIGTASIGEDVTERDAAEAKLLEQLDELRRFQKVTVDRELRMIELEAELDEVRRRTPA